LMNFLFDFPHNRKEYITDAENVNPKTSLFLFFLFLFFMRVGTPPAQEKGFFEFLKS